MYHWLKIANSCLGMVSNIMFDIFGTFQISTNVGTLGALFVAEILPEIKGNTLILLKHIFVNLNITTLDNMEHGCTDLFDISEFILGNLKPLKL